MASSKLSSAFTKGKSPVLVIQSEGFRVEGKSGGCFASQPPDSEEKDKGWLVIKQIRIREHGLMLQESLCLTPNGK